MLDIARVRADVTRDLDVLKFEVTTLSRMFAETQFFGNPSNFPNAHHGYLMTCTAKIDALSSYWSGLVGSKGQTHRMTSFMNRYLHPGRVEEHRVAVQMFRHTLMHTGSLRFLYDRTTDTKYTWRLHFGDGLRSEWHYRITAEDEQYQDQLCALPVSTGSTSAAIKALNVSIPRLVDDLDRAVQSYLAEFDADVNLQLKYENAQSRIVLQEFT